MYCQYCGAKNDDSAFFCNKCGTTLLNSNISDNIQPNDVGEISETTLILYDHIRKLNDNELIAMIEKNHKEYPSNLMQVAVDEADNRGIKLSVWFWKFGDNIVGPLKKYELFNFAASGKLSQGDFISCNGTDNWVRASSVIELFSNLSYTVSPLPEPPVGDDKSILGIIKKFQEKFNQLHWVVQLLISAIIYLCLHQVIPGLFYILLVLVIIQFIYNMGSNKRGN